MQCAEPRVCAVCPEKELLHARVCAHGRITQRNNPLRSFSTVLRATCGRGGSSPAPSRDLQAWKLQAEGTQQPRKRILGSQLLLLPRAVPPREVLVSGSSTWLHFSGAFVLQPEEGPSPASPVLLPSHLWAIPSRYPQLRGSFTPTPPSSCTGTEANRKPGCNPERPRTQEPAVNPHHPKANSSSSKPPPPQSESLQLRDPPRSSRGTGS